MEGFALVIVLLLWTRSLMMYFVISAMKGKRKEENKIEMHADPAPWVTSTGSRGSAIHSLPTLCISFARHECDRRRGSEREGEIQLIP